MEKENEMAKDEYKKHLIDIIENIDNLEILTYLYTFIKLKIKAE